MSHIQYIRLEHGNIDGLRLPKHAMTQDPAIREAVRRTREDIAAKYGLKKFSEANYYASVALHDTEVQRHLKEVRKEMEGDGGKANYHRAIPINRPESPTGSL
jgi:hypothetical protein